jgi:hypothetical protein
MIVNDAAARAENTPALVGTVSGLLSQVPTEI